jgi:hypothetical protein
MAKEPLTELEQLEIEERKQALESKKLNDELVRLQLAEKKSEVEMKRNNKERGKRDADEAIAKLREMQARCNHHLGGEGELAIVYGQGDMERPTAISGIQFTDQNILLRCNRCGKKWSQAVPAGDETFGPWAEGIELFRKSQFKQIAVVGGLVVKKQPAVA